MQKKRKLIKEEKRKALLKIQIDFLNEARQAWRNLQRSVDKKWQRTLPFGQYFVDRWEKAKILGFGKGSSIYDSALVIGRVKVGKNTWIGPFTVLDGSGGLKIGANCSISAGVQIYTHDSVKWALSGGREKYEYACVSISDCCYIGPNVIISKKVSIGKNCVIGANAFINRDVPANSIAFGTPAKLVGKVIIDRKKKIKFKLY